MGWRIVKKGFKAKRMKRQPRIRWERLGLDMMMPEKLPTPIEEIRREVLKLASRGMKQATRSSRPPSMPESRRAAGDAEPPSRRAPIL